MNPNFRLSHTACGVVLLLLALGTTSCHKKEDTSGLIHVSLQADWYPQPEHGGFFDAIAKGYYKAEGLDVTVLPGGAYTSTGALIASGKIQFALSSSDSVLEAIANSDQPLIAIGATMQRDPQGVMVHAESPVHTWADINGHSVAVKSGSAWFEFIVQKYHLDKVQERPLTYSVANFVRDPTYMQQCFITSEPYFANGAGSATRVLLTSDAGYKPYRVFVTSTGYLRDHPDVVAKFTRATLKGWKDYMQDPSAANKLIEQQNPAMSRDWAAYSYNQLKKGNFVTGDDASGALVGQMDPARWQTMYEQLRALHVLTRDIDPKTAYTLQFLK
jgi:NitT/TauT family transport system substrate-binding protein